MALTLPKFVVLKSNYNNKYLRYIHEDVQLHCFLKISGEEVVSPYAKFEVETAKSGNGLVHIRSCYNNKYWVRWSANNYSIVAAADEPEEDQSRWSCTLFKPVYVDDDAKTVRFLHVQLGHYACLSRSAAPFDSCLFAESQVPNQQLYDVFTIIDWGSQLILPKRIVFKGDNGRYLSARTIERYPYLMFDSTDIGDPTVGNEIFTTNNGNIRIKSDYFDKFWRRSPNWIWADSDDTTSNNLDTLFWPSKVDSNVIALRNLGNNNFCKRLTTEGKTSCLNAGVSTISREARLVVEEPVFLRKIENVNFRLMDARIYDQRPISMDEQSSANHGSEPTTLQFRLLRKETRSSTWNASVSLKLGVKTEISTGVPLLAEGKIEISFEFNAAYEWGETIETSTEREVTHTVIAPPMTEVTVRSLSTIGSCDVPFSYTQRDSLTNGKEVTYFMDDGIYTGINNYSFRFEVHQKPL